MARQEEPRILLIDIETFPLLMYAWESWDASALRIVENTSIASFSAKWLGGKQITKCLADYPGYKPHSRDDRKLLSDLWALLDEAHIVVAHNGKKFDKKKITYRFILHRLGIPSPYAVVDTLREVKRVSAWDSHRLNELCRQLEIGMKLRTGGADLWFDCLEGKKAAWSRMKRYNARDVSPLLEGLYLELRPWIDNHPNVGLYQNRPVCPKCGSADVEARGYQRTVAATYQRFQCKSCGGWARSPQSIRGRQKPLANAR